MTASLITVDDARREVLAAARPLPDEPVPLDRALGRVLAEGIESANDLPPFDSSAMDGFAVAAAGEPAELPVVGEARAGHPAERPLTAGEAMAISTGAPIPDGADAVVPIERAEVANGRVSLPAVQAGANVRRAGEDVRAGDLVLGAGTQLGPPEVAVLASLGRAELRCGARPRVAIVVTGDELVAPDADLEPGQIRDSNAWALAAQGSVAGAEVVRRDLVRDDRAATEAALAEALSAADVVCVSGGVSVGRHDHVKPALATLGVDERFWGVSLKPGKPTWFGVAGEKLVFGLPGNPVSAMVTFQLFVRPALRRLQGADPLPPRVAAVTDAPIARDGRREQAVRCRVSVRDDGVHVEPTGPQGSHVLTSMLGAGALALVPAGDGAVAAGERVDIEPLGTLDLP